MGGDWTVIVGSILEVIMDQNKTTKRTFTCKLEKNNLVAMEICLLSWRNYVSTQKDDD